MAKPRKPVNLTLPDENPSGETSPPRDDSSATAVESLIAQGKIVPRVSPGYTDDPGVREQFSQLMMIGAQKNAIMNLLKLSAADYTALLRSHLESAVETLSEQGVIGSVALSFAKLDHVSNRMMKFLAQTDDSVAKNRTAVFRAVQLVKEVEAEKINLLVKTGAIKIKKKVEIHAHLEKGNSIDLFTGEKAQRVMVEVIAELGRDSADGEEEEGEVVEGELEFKPTPKDGGPT